MDNATYDEREIILRAIEIARYRLQQMVLEENPLNYLAKFL